MKLAHEGVLVGIDGQHRIAVGIADWLGLAVCVGIGPTKTLAKLANHCAKKRLAGVDAVCDFTTMAPDERLALFERIEVGEVWGVGRKISAGLEAMGILTVRQLHYANAETLRSRFSVVFEQTVRELRGMSCLDLAEVVPDKQQIMSSRSFGALVYDLAELEEAVSSYIARAAEKPCSGPEIVLIVGAQDAGYISDGLVSENPSQIGMGG